MLALARIFTLASFSFLTLPQGADAGPCASFPLDIKSVSQEAQNGNAYCQAVLALEYLRGTSGTQSDVKYHALASGLVESDDPLAIYVVATLFRNGSRSEVIKQDKARSVEIFTRFVSKLDVDNSTNPNHLIAMGIVRRYGRDDQAADHVLGCSYLQRAANLGHPHGMYWVADCIADDHIEGATQQDRRIWLAKAAEFGHPHAAWSLGEINFEAGLLDDALANYQDAASFGAPNYALRLGRIFEVGLLRAPNWHRAEEYYQQASKAGNDSASYRLG